MTASIDNAFLESYEPLRVDDNAAISAMHEAVSATSDVAQGMQNGTQDLLSAADSLSRRTEQQAANLEETTVSLEEITAPRRKALTTPMWWCVKPNKRVIP